jgi:hypothetical protein
VTYELYVKPAAPDEPAGFYATTTSESVAQRWARDNGAECVKETE